MTDLKIFKNDQFGEIRTVEENGTVLFCGSDIAGALGYSNTRDAINRHCKPEGVVKRDGVSQTTNQYGVTTEQTVEMKFINEGNVYRLITHSKLPAAEQFEHWVFDEVLPTIRRNGAYMTDDTLEQALTSPDFLIQLATKLKEEKAKRKQLEDTVAVQKQQLAELTPKASYYDVVLSCKDAISITEIAKDYGKSAKWLNKLLHEKGIQFRQGDIWLLYQKYAEKGYTITKTQTYSGNDGAVHSKLHTYWTQKGRLFIYETLKAAGILPTMERNEAA